MLWQTLVVSDGEVGIDVFVWDHGEIEMMAIYRIICISGTDQLN